MHTRNIVVRSLIAAVFVATSLLTATSVRATPSPASTLTVIIAGEPDSLDPAVDYSLGGATYLGSVYDGLVRATGTNRARITPDLATHWTESRNGRTWTFYLRPHVKFHDGSPVNAAAVKFSWERMLHRKFGAYPDYSEISGVDVVNPLTVRFHLKYPFSAFLPSMANIWATGIVSPKTAAHHKITSTGASYLDTHDAGSGPYELVSWQHHQRIILKRFPGYWGGWRGHHANRVVIEWPSSSSTQRLELEQGGADASMNLTPQDFAAVSTEPGIHVETHTAQDIKEIWFNTAKGALRNKLVRQALSDAFDYAGVARGVFRGHAVRMQGVGSRGLANFVPQHPLYSFNLNRAKQLLKRSGVSPANLSFTLGYLPGNATFVQIAQIYQADLAKIGVKVKLQGIENSTYGKLIDSPKTTPDMWIADWLMDYSDNEQLYYDAYYSKSVPPGGLNATWFRNHKVDGLITRAVRSPKQSEAHSLYQKACHIIYDQAPAVFMVQPQEQVALRSNVHGYAYDFLYGSYYYPLYKMWKS